MGGGDHNALYQYSYTGLTNSFTAGAYYCHSITLPKGKYLFMVTIYHTNSKGYYDTFDPTSGSATTNKILQNQIYDERNQTYAAGVVEVTTDTATVRPTFIMYSTGTVSGERLACIKLL